MNPVSAVRLVPPDLRAAQFKQVAEFPTPSVAGGNALTLRELESSHPVPDLRAASGPAAGGSFESVLKDFVQAVHGKQTAASQAVNALLSGQNIPLHEAMIAMEEASVAFHLMVEVRNKLLESYQELMRMQL